MNLLMHIKDIALAILISALWGFSFVVMRFGLQHVPPLLFCCARFFFTSFPAIFFVRRPNIPWHLIAAYGLFMFVIKFSLLFFSIHIGLDSGLASLLIQSQVFITILLTAFFLKEKIKNNQMIGMLTSLMGIILVSFHVGSEINIEGFVFIIMSATSWAIANLLSKKLRVSDIVPLIIWASFFAWPPLFLISYVLEGKNLILLSLQHISWNDCVTIIYMAYPVTLFGFSVWSRLLSYYPATNVVSFALLIPLFGLYGSVICFHESMELWKIFATVLIISGLSITLLSNRDEMSKC